MRMPWPSSGSGRKDACGSKRQRACHNRRRFDWTRIELTRQGELLRTPRGGLLRRIDLTPRDPPLSGIAAAREMDIGSNANHRI